MFNLHQLLRLKYFLWVVDFGPRLSKAVLQLALVIVAVSVAAML